MGPRTLEEQQKGARNWAPRGPSKLWEREVIKNLLKRVSIASVRGELSLLAIPSEHGTTLHSVALYDAALCANESQCSLPKAHGHLPACAGNAASFSTAALQPKAAPSPTTCPILSTALSATSCKRSSPRLNPCTSATFPKERGPLLFTDKLYESAPSSLILPVSGLPTLAGCLLCDGRVPDRSLQLGN
jgi:hypothetical protein